VEDGRVGSRPLGLIVALVLGALGAPALAHADTYCVNTTGCDHAEGNSFQQALTDAQINPGPDTVKLGALPLATPTGFTYVSNYPVAVVGAGGRDAGQLTTSLSDSSPNPTGHTVLSVRGSSASTITGLDVVVPGGSGNGNVGIDTNGTVSNVLVQAGLPASDVGTGVVLETGAVITRSDVRMATSSDSNAVKVAGAGTAVDDSRIEASVGYTEVSGTGRSGTARHLQITSSNAGVVLTQGVFSFEDVLMLNRSDNQNVHNGVVVSTSSGNASLSLDHVTMIGTGATFSTAIIDVAQGGTRAEVFFRNGVFSKYDQALGRAGDAGSTANLTTDFSDYSDTAPPAAGNGTLTETNHLAVVPGFLSTTDFHLRSDSPLIDAGDPAGLGASESTTDASGQPRITDGDGNCSPRRDIGAYEFQPGPRAPNAAASAAPTTALTGQAVTFDAAGSCDADGDALTYSWTFDDGGGAPGASLQRSFSAAGLHFGTVTVSDSTGRSATATAAVFVSAPPPPPQFAGVSIAKQTVRATKKGGVKIKVGCPAATAGACAGTLTLGGQKATFSIAPGAANSVTVKLSKAKLKALRKAKRLDITATAVAHDANGSSKTSTGKLTLLAPR
jgi:hypothetical protein